MTDDLSGDLTERILRAVHDPVGVAIAEAISLGVQHEVDEALGVPDGPIESALRPVEDAVHAAVDRAVAEAVKAPPA